MNVDGLPQNFDLRPVGDITPEILEDPLPQIQHHHYEHNQQKTYRPSQRMRNQTHRLLHSQQKLVRMRPMLNLRIYLVPHRQHLAVTLQAADTVPQ